MARVPIIAASEMNCPLFQVNENGNFYPIYAVTDTRTSQTIAYLSLSGSWESWSYLHVQPKRKWELLEYVCVHTVLCC